MNIEDLTLEKIDQLELGEEMDLFITVLVMDNCYHEWTKQRRVKHTWEEETDTTIKEEGFFYMCKKCGLRPFESYSELPKVRNYSTDSNDLADAVEYLIEKDPREQYFLLTHYRYISGYTWEARFSRGFAYADNDAKLAICRAMLKQALILKENPE